MALFKVNRGNSSTLPTTMVDGWAYFCTDTGEFFIDYADANGELHRKQISAGEAKKIAGVEGAEGQFVSFDSNGNLVATDNPTDAVQDALTSHTTNTNNPHGLTAEQLGLDGSMMLSEIKGGTAQLPSSSKWLSVAYGNGRFVAVSEDSNTVAYSDDGITWTTATMPYSLKWSSVTYGNGRFVAVAFESITAAYSDDGINWTTSMLPIKTRYWYLVTYGNNRFVALALSSTIAAYSDDGETWIETRAFSNTSYPNWSSVAYGNGRFIAVRSDSVYASQSEDGINWTLSTVMGSSGWSSLTYGNGRFIVVASDSTAAAYSDDGDAWIKTTLPDSAKWCSVTYGNGRFVAVSSNSTMAAYSDDGATWIEATLPSSADWRYVTYGNGMFIAVAYNSTTVSISYDGSVWYETVPDKIFLADYIGTDITETVKGLVAPDLTGIATETFVTEAIAGIEIPEVDITGLATETFVTEAIAAIPEPDLSSKQDKLTGTEGQTVEFDSTGNLVAVDKTATSNTIIRVW